MTWTGRTTPTGNWDGRTQTDYLVTEALDFLMTEDNNYIVVEDSLQSNSTARTIPTSNWSGRPTI